MVVLLIDQITCPENRSLEFGHELAQTQHQPPHHNTTMTNSTISHHKATYRYMELCTGNRDYVQERYDFSEVTSSVYN
jgi:hypothetical protein